MNDEYSAPIELPEDDLAPTEPTFYSESGEYLTFSELLPSNATTANELFTPHVRGALEQIYMQQGEAEYTRYEQQLIDRARATKGVSVGDIRTLLKPVLKDLQLAKKQVDAEDRAEWAKKQREKKASSCPYPDFIINRFGDIIVQPTYANFKAMCNTLDIHLQMDVIRRVQAVPPKIRAVHSVNEAANAFALEVQDHCTREGIRANTKTVLSWIKAAADESRVNPVREYLEQQSRKYAIPPAERGQTIINLFGCLSFENDVTEQELSSYLNLFGKWLVQCVAMAHNEHGNYGAEFVLVLQSKEQGIGKTSFFRYLCSPPELQGYFLEGRQLNPANKDDVLEDTSCWICELGELEGTTKKKEVDRLKAFITNKSDRVRAPYDPASCNYPRFTSFAGTVNETGFLTEAGRRFVVIPIIDIDRKQMNQIDVGKLWAEAYDAYKEAPNSFRLSKEELQATIRSSDKFRAIFSEEQAILDSFDWDADSADWNEWTATEIAKELGLKEVARVGKALRNMGYERTADVNIDRRYRVLHGSSRYMLPPLTDEAIQRTKHTEQPYETGG